MADAKTLSPNQIKAGDKLIREQDHLHRPDDSVIVRKVKRHGTIVYDLEGYWRHDETAKALCSQGYRFVERNGERIGTFFTRYW